MQQRPLLFVIETAAEEAEVKTGVYHGCMQRGQEQFYLKIKPIFNKCT